MVKRASILFFEKTFIRPFGGIVRGVEAFNLKLVEDLVSSGFDVCVPADSSWRGTLGDIVGEAGFAAMGGGGAPTLALMKAAALSIREARRRGGSFDLAIVANDVNGAVLPVRLAIAARVARSSLVFAHKLPYPYFLRFLAGKVDRIVCVSDAVAAGFRDAGFAARTFVQYGVVNAGVWHPRETVKSPVPTSSLSFCVFGSLDSDWKGADTALAAWHLMPEEFRRTHTLHLVAYSKAPDFGADSGVVAHGWTDPTRLPALLRSMDVLVAPSRDPRRLMETFSQCVVQGMLTALPVIHTRIPAFVEKFDCGGGIAADSPEEVAAAMQTLAADPALRRKLGEEARRTALERYVWDYGAFCENHIRPCLEKISVL
jgi:glycosyltransferase involved in cell wall biosynthesis